HSQGGANVATLCAAQPDLWSKCVLLNPMLPSCDPFDSWPSCFRWLNFGGLGPNYLVWAQYDSRSDWERNQPRALLKKLKGKENPPKLFVTACRDDKFDLFDGAKAWVDEARQLGLSPESAYEAGCDHFHWPAEKVVRFLEGQ